MKKEISKGTQKFIWHMAAFIAVFVLALVAINKFEYGGKIEHLGRCELNTFVAEN